MRRRRVLVMCAAPPVLGACLSSWGSAGAPGAVSPLGGQVAAPTESPPEPFPWEPIESVRGELARALGLPDWPALTARTPEMVAVMRYPNGVELQELTADRFAEWVRARWAAGITVGEARFVSHFPSLEIPTIGWRPAPPSGSSIHFVYHANLETRRWYLDVVQYE